MTKGASTFLAVNNAPSSQDIAGQAINVAMDPGSLVDAINALTETVKALKPEIRIDLPAMNPVIQASPVPVSVTVPELPPNPPVSVTLPDFPAFPKIPEYPVIKVPKLFAAAVCLAVLASNVLGAVAQEFIRSLLHR